MRPFDRWNAVIYGQLPISHLARHVLLQLIGQRNSTTGQLNPSTESLSRSTGMSRRSVVSAIKELKGADIIFITNHNGTSNSYDFNLQPYRKKQEGAHVVLR
jgi:DNA-binding transcriptional MocR family regulator